MFRACRFLLVLLLAVTLSGTTAVAVSAGLAAHSAAATEPCCKGGCPDAADCGMACGVTARCGTALAVLFARPEPVSPTVAIVPVESSRAGSLSIGRAPSGPERPPRI